jgi:CTP:molybdopterin cytidylyltransferase MocA
MGRPKLLLPWGKTSVLGHLLAVWNELHAIQTAVVCAAGDQPMQKEIERLGFSKDNRIINPQPERGMFSSIQCAAAWKGWQNGLTHWVMALGDQPHLRPGTLRALLDFAGTRPEKICQPSRHGRPRHPVILPENAFRRLQDTPAKNLKEFLQREKIALCESGDPGLDLDLDTPADYAKALGCFQYENLHSK